MILVDTSVWADHLRRGDARLATLLEPNCVCIHAFVVGELACGNLKTRNSILDLLRALPTLPTATDDEVLFFIERHHLMGHGIGYIDAHLLAATAMQGTYGLWTRDKRLSVIATELGLAYMEGEH
jgi:predicted nucleic acid-binding protein